MVGELQVFHRMLVSRWPLLSRCYWLTMSSLEKDCPRRATPWRMLEHPWMVEMKSKKVNMAHFLKQVWDWKD